MARAKQERKEEGPGSVKNRNGRASLLKSQYHSNHPDPERVGASVEETSKHSGGVLHNKRRYRICSAGGSDVHIVEIDSYPVQLDDGGDYCIAFLSAVRLGDMLPKSERSGPAADVAGLSRCFQWQSSVAGCTLFWLPPKTKLPDREGGRETLKDPSERPGRGLKSGVQPLFVIWQPASYDSARKSRYMRVLKSAQLLCELVAMPFCGNPISSLVRFWRGAQPGVGSHWQSLLAPPGSAKRRHRRQQILSDVLILRIPALIFQPRRGENWSPEASDAGR